MLLTQHLEPHTDSEVRSNYAAVVSPPGQRYRVNLSRPLGVIHLEVVDVSSSPVAPTATF